MNLRDLKYLVAVAEHQHFGKAADACFVSQPALSMQLQKLESTLGVQLFERNNKHVFITQVGKEIVARAKTILLGADELYDVAKAFQDPLAGDFRLGAFPTLAPYYLPKIVPLIHKRLPKLKLLLIEEKTHTLLDMLKSGTLDAAFIALPTHDNDLIAKPILEDEFLLAVPKNHRLARQRSVDLHDIKKERLLLLEDGHCLRAQALEVCALVGVSEPNDFRATSLETLRQMVVAGVGVTLIPKIAARADQNIRYLPFRENHPSRTIGLVWRQHTAKGICISKLYELMN
jgi:LysR family hydrogen peroxide-inducible transcriptional activator